MVRMSRLISSSGVSLRMYRERTTSVSCPVCRAEPGMPCKGRHTVHVMRASLARRVGFRLSQERRDRVDFERMAEVVPEGQYGTASVEHFVIDQRTALFTALREVVTGGREQAADAGRYAKLRVNGCLVMSDTPMERDSNREVVRQARGHVLIAGLGLGLIVLPILRKTVVSRVTVVEESADVIALVEGPVRRRAGSTSRKLTVVHADIFDWRPSPARREFDVIYFDIWSDISTDNLVDMTYLRRQFARRLLRGGWAGCWKQEELQLLQRRTK
jgi:hypothetical protein